MELLFAIRGQRMYQEQFLNELSGVRLPFRAKAKPDGTIDENEEMRTLLFQLGVKNYQIIGVSFPKEHKELVCNTILGMHDKADKYKKFDKYFNWVRKLLGLKEIGNYDKSEKIVLTKDSLDIIGLGIKEDEMAHWGEAL